MDNIFGTAGIRANAGKYPLDFETLPNIGIVLANFFNNKYGCKSKILIACDTRASAYLIKSLIKTGLLTNNIDVYDAQVLPTPAVIYLVHEIKSYDAGIIITASHNPYDDNGIKIIDRTSGNLSVQEEQLITSQILNQTLNPILDFNKSGKEYHVRSCTDTYIQKIVSLFSTQDFSKIKVVIDCANGAYSEIAPTIFTKLGIKVIAINTNPNGVNINHNCGATHPAILQKTVLKYQADIGFAFDGDGDRVIAVTADGKIKDGDDLIAFLSTNHKYLTQTQLVGTIVSNLGLELWLTNNNKNLIRANVGEKNLLHAMQAAECLIGGEPSSHIILKDFANHSDGLFVSLKILETAIQNQNWILETFSKTNQINYNLEIKYKKDLNTDPIASLIKKYQSLLNPGRLIVRYSGTENLLRIMVDGLNDTADIAQNLINELSAILN